MAHKTQRQECRVPDGIAKFIEPGDIVHADGTDYHVISVSTENGSNVLLHTREQQDLRYMAYARVDFTYRTF
jgi:hypothetical protein